MRISSINVTDMVGRHVANEHGAIFRIVSVRYDLDAGLFLAWVAECDADDNDSGEEEAGITSFRGWTLL